MPAPSKTKGTLKNTKYLSKLKRKSQSRKRNQGVYLETLDLKQQYEFLKMLAGFALLRVRQMETEKKITPVYTCDNSFQTYYTQNDAFKIIEELSTLSKNERQLKQEARREFGRIRRNAPSNKLLALSIILLLITGPMAQKVNAKWNEFSSPPGELSAYDTISAGLVGAGTAVLKKGAYFPPLLFIGGGMAGCGMLVKSAGSVHRLIDHVDGKYPLQENTAKLEALGVFLPGVPSLVRESATKMTGEHLNERSAPTMGEPIFTGLSDYAVSTGQVSRQTAELAREFAQRQVETAINTAPALGYGAAGEYGISRYIQTNPK